MVDGVGLRGIGAVVALFCSAMFVVPAMAGKNCVCKANGHDYHEGDIACILGKLSRCEMFVNNTTWKKLADDCPEVKLEWPLTLAERLRLLQATPPPNAC